LTRPLAASVTVGEALREAGERLEAAGVDTPRLDAELLLAEALEVERAQLVLQRAEVVERPALERFEALVQRRAAREPVAYILGRKPFRQIELTVDPRVLIPRPETELLVEAGLELPEGARVLDVGTGSGAVALALKHERPDLEVIGSDVSADAIEVARENAQRLGIDVRFLRADLFEGVSGPVDAVLANLPYVADGASGELAPEITRYEPAGALFAGPDGLKVIRRLVRMLEGIPMVALEVGFDQAGAVTQLLAHQGFDSVHALADLGGHDRVIVGRRGRAK
jgi:release factor glutamine methyltransferase